MLLNALNRYFNNFKGFSREIWILTLMTFINRAGTMVLPFMSKYLNEDLHFSLSQVSWIMACLGAGSMLGSWLGGKLTDKIGFYKIMVFSLLTSGIAFFILQYITSFVGLCIGMFLIMSIADMFRPAMFVSLGAYAKKENRTRALALVRSAINLGFIIGPATAGIVIMGVGYKGLFWVDGTTCLVAILIFWLNVKEKKKSPYLDKEHPGEVLTQSVFKDKPFMIHLIVCVITGILFFQLFYTIPLYHKVQFGLNEVQTGMLLSMNGFIIFFLELPLVNYIERKKLDKLKMIIYGCSLMSISLFLLMVNNWAGILIIMMLFMTFAEMFTFPFSNSFAVSRAPKGQEGRYMAVFSMSYSLAQILSAKIGLEIIHYYKYQANWLFMGTLGMVGAILGYWVYKLTAKEVEPIEKLTP